MLPGVSVPGVSVPGVSVPEAGFRAAWEASPISHVTEHSAPLCLVHGIFDYGVQVPMGQSVRMFKAYTEKGVKSLLLCNNNGPFGEDPEVKMAVVEFLTSRV